ncbi:protease inhibitor carrapatin [Drosophila grimshawi]|uniref:protease inhibitor carrapatin n=1 Tax=Drosophila grimshawi TaxID=7222 RepID=UPI000C86E6F7|nr:protease inhibitor carrapatin [Drosophila grimshawi]
MKFILILACLALFVAHTQAQQCRGRLLPNRKVCIGGRDEGRTGRGCERFTNPNMWWYDGSDRTCKRMMYRGCGGNNNRYCTRAECERRCRLTAAVTTAAPTTAAPTTAAPTAAPPA